MKHFLLAAGLLAGLAAGCSGPDTPATPKAVAATQVEALTKDFDTWYRYTYYHVLLAREYEALDTSGRPLPKKAFLRQLATGRVLAVAIVSGTGQPPIYQLCDLPGGHDPAIRATSKQLAEEALRNDSREGQSLPTFSFVDLNGVAYTSANTRGKIVVLKFWYTTCIPCVEEFPAINALADKYRQNHEVLFVSLAMNEAKTLRTFLKGRPANFAVVPASKTYLIDTLQVLEYPTHLIIGRDGRIIKATNKASDLAIGLAKVVPPAGAAPR